MKPVRLVLSIFAVIGLLGFTLLAILEVNSSNDQIAMIATHCNTGATVEKPAKCQLIYSDVSKELISLVGATLATLVAGFLGIASVKWGQVGSSFENVRAVGGGFEPLGWALAIGSMVFVFGLLYGTYGLWVIGNAVATYKQLEIISSPVIGQMSSTGVGLILGGLGAFVGGRAK